MNILSRRPVYSIPLLEPAMQPVPPNEPSRPAPEAAARRPGRLGTPVLLVALAAAALGLTAWKRADLHAQEAADQVQYEPTESVTFGVATPREHVDTTTSIGTVRALRSVVLQNELSGTVREVALVPGHVVEEGALLVALDVSVEEAELAAQEARAALAETLLGRTQRASQKSGASEADVDRARAELDIARAEVARTRAVIERKTIRAPFRARVGLADVHPGQYLTEGSVLTTLQGLDEAVHVDFSVPQRVAAGLREGERVEVTATGHVGPLSATIVALDARIDPATRNALVRARIDDADAAPAPGSSARMSVPVGEPRSVLTVSVLALRKGPSGDHVFVVEPDAQGRPRAHLRSVVGGSVLGDEVVIESGLSAGEQVVASGSFKLQDGALVTAAEAAPAQISAP
jgi:membrane fusion protein (multidrug efflux system)